MAHPLFSDKNFAVKCSLHFEIRFNRPSQCLCSLFCPDWTSDDFFKSISAADKVNLPSQQSTLDIMWLDGNLDWIFKQGSGLEHLIKADSAQRYDIRYYVFYRRLFDRLLAKHTLRVAFKQMNERLEVKQERVYKQEPSD